MSDETLERLLNSKKYRGVCPDTVRRVWEDCRQRYKKAKDAEKAAREALHGITGAFMTPEEARYLAWDMQSWAVEGRTDDKLEKLLTRHASTRERLPLTETDALYARLFSATIRPKSVLDLACGINPIYLAARGFSVHGVDISGEAVSLINAFGDNYGLSASASCADLLCPGAIPKKRFDLALLFKALPLLERQKAGSAQALMEAVNAAFLVVSFPTRTLGGHNVGMAAHYDDWLRERLPKNRTLVGSFESRNELYYILKER